ncbi:MAG: hypothetical protein HRU31_15485 [Rhodobacteraceae bacterium]|nr:hypothetical protein [Paracoccaceae bacterium]
MMRATLMAGLLATLAAPLTAQQTGPAVLVPSPGGAADFCYYNGVAFSKMAVITIDVTNRRETPEATQKAMLQCVSEGGSENLIWTRMPNE